MKPKTSHHFLNHECDLVIVYPMDDDGIISQPLEIRNYEGGDVSISDVDSTIHIPESSVRAVAKYLLSLSKETSKK